MNEKGKISAGLLMYKIDNGQLKVLLVHPGGPLFVNKDERYWGIPKGVVKSGENEKIFDAAVREFQEETGIKVDKKSNFIELGAIVKNSGKTIHSWAFQGDFNGKITSNLFKMEWPPKSGRIAEFPEIDKGEFFTIEQAKIKMGDRQFEFIGRLISILENKH
jgi:predicted NUDIX family NTP pyrophosphohydrolase